MSFSKPPLEGDAKEGEGGVGGGGGAAQYTSHSLQSFCSKKTNAISARIKKGPKNAVPRRYRINGVVVGAADARQSTAFGIMRLDFTVVPQGVRQLFGEVSTTVSSGEIAHTCGYHT